MSSSKVTTELGSEDVLTLLVRYAVPSMIAMMASSTYNVVDSILIGQGVGDLAISGMAVTVPLTNLSIALGAMVGVGASTVISMRLGQRDYNTAQHILGNTISLNVLVGGLFTLLTLPFLDDIMMFFGASEATLPYASEYMMVILAGNVMTHLYFGLNAVLRSVGHPHLAMFCTLLTVVLNIVLDWLFIFIFGWGIAGAAWATVLSQVVALCIQLAVFSKQSELIHLRRSIFTPNPKIIYQIFAIGMSPFAQHVAGCLVVLLFNNQLLALGGDMAVGAFGISQRLLLLSVTLVLGLVQGMQPIVGFNWGARQNDRVWKVVYYTMGGATIITTGLFLIAVFFPEPVIALFGCGPELAALSVRCFRISALFFPLVGSQIVIGNFFQCIGHAGKSVFISLTRQLLVIAPLLIILPKWWELDGAFWSSPVSDFISFVLAWGMFIYIRHRMEAKTAK